MQVAVRKPKKGKLVTLWLHEYFAVNGSKTKGAAKRDVDIYQAVEFRTDCRRATFGSAPGAK